MLRFGWLGYEYNNIRVKLDRLKKTNNYNPIGILNEYFFDFQHIARNEFENKDYWDAKNFWFQINKTYQEELILSLEERDANDEVLLVFKALLYGVQEKEYDKRVVETEVVNSDIKERILEEVKYLIEIEEYQQATRYGYFYIRLGLLKPRTTDKYIWLLDWKNEIKKVADIPEGCMVDSTLINQPFYLQGRKWTISNTLPHIRSIQHFFQMEKHEIGEKLVIQEVVFTDNFRKVLPGFYKN